jgi:hypothetical protein
MENLLPLVCRWVLNLVPVLFVGGHLAAVGETSDFVRGWKFDPCFDLISTYACRSSGGWAITGCMVGFAFVLGFISWHAAQSRPGFFAWFTAVVAGVGMVNLLEVAWHPMKPTRDIHDRIRAEAESPPDEHMGMAVSHPRTGISPYHVSVRSFWLHAGASDSAQRMILLAMTGTLFLWRGKTGHPARWLRLHQMALAWIIVAALGSVWLPGFPGIHQRLAWIGVYFWMRIVVREIERTRAAQAETRI